MKLKPIKIDNIAIETPVFLSPLAGITDVPYRHAVKQFGAGMVYSEMLSGHSVVCAKKENKSHTIVNSDYPIGVQLAGSNLEIMAKAAKIAEDMGATIIDINMGCPAKKVVNGVAGSALMKDETLAAKIIETVVKSVSIPVTVKMRLGWDCDNQNASRLSVLAEENGAKLITVHGRTRQQFFSGEANWLAIKEVKNSVKIPVIANGDIVDRESATKALEQSGADGIMIGRGSYGRPWFIAHLMAYLKDGTILNEPTEEEKRNIMLNHYNEILDYYGNDAGLKIARKHLAWYSKGYKNSSAFRILVNNSENVSEIKSAIYNLFDNVA